MGMKRELRGQEHAIVIGGGIGGLLSAAVLARHYQRVTIIDRDTGMAGPDAQPTVRSGVPQGHHVHVLLSLGWRLLESMFPGLDARLQGAGAKPVDWIKDVVWETPFGRSPRVASDLHSRLCSRPLLELSVRAELLTNERVRLADGYEVTGVQTTGTPPRILGVEVREHGAHTGATLTADDLRADLVVDTSGRSSQCAQWLEDLGYPAPAETIIDARLGYASRIYRRDPKVDWRVLYVMNRAPSTPHSGVVYEIEDDRWIVTLVGYNGHFPPTDEAGFLECARNLAKPAIYEAIRDAEPLSKIRGYRRTENRMRHFEGMRRWPVGLLVLGDAACALNPVYGQGMTVAALAATVLGETLRKDPSAARLGPTFQRRLATSMKDAFTTATSDDLRWPETSGHASPGLRLMHKYVDRVMTCATKDARIHARLLEVLQMVRPASALLSPRILQRALRTRVPASSARPSEPAE